MFGEGHPDSIIQRGFDDALACQDMLEPAPPPPAPLGRVIAWLFATMELLTKPPNRAVDESVLDRSPVAKLWR